MDERTRHRHVGEIFLLVRTMPAAFRAKELDERCAGDAELRRAVDRLLATDLVDDEQANGAWPGPANVVEIECAAAESDDAPDVEGEAGSTRIGDYQLIDRIGEGGAAVVWRGRQLHPVRRDVAIKILRHPPGSPADLRRFDREVRALSSLDHPHVGSLLDIGVTESGRPYLVMPLVSGVRLDDRAIRGLDVRDRVQVIRQIADAVHHAHVRGVVHRDLAPGNVLVDPRSGGVHATVIDFGISRILDDLDEAGAGRTQPGLLLGTPRYLSPEQAEGGAAASDARADIHAIGVLAYELLSGLHPFEGSGRDPSGSGPGTADAHALRRRIIEIVPARPSTMTSDQQTARVIRRELDWIILDCLRKAPSDRPSSARFVVEELDRFLAGEPLRTEPPTRGSRLAARWRRHRAVMLTTGGIGLALVVGLVGTIYGLLEARDAVVAIEASRTELIEAEAEASARADEASRVARFQERIMAEVAPAEVAATLRREMQDAIGQPLDPATAGPDEIAIRITETDLVGVASQVIGRAFLTDVADQARLEFDDAPLVRARVLGGIGTAYLSIGLADPAIAIFEEVASLRRTAGGAADGVRSADAGLASALDAVGRHDDAGAIHRRIVEEHQADHGVQAPQTLAARHNLAVHLLERGDRDAALPEIREVVAARSAVLGEEAPATIDSQLVLAAALARHGATRAEAGRIYGDVLAIQRRTLSPDDPRLLLTLSMTASFAIDQGQSARALDLATEAWEGRRAHLGAEHPSTIVAAGTRGLALWKLRRLEEAREVLVDVLRVRTSLYGAGHRDVLRSRHNLALVIGDLGDPDAAIAEHRAILGVLDRRGQRHGRLGLTQLNAIGVLLRRQGQADEAVPLLEEVVATRVARFGSRHPDSQRARSNLVQALDDAGRLDDAIGILEDMIGAISENRGADDPATLGTRMRRGALMARGADPQSGIEELRAVHARCVSVNGSDSISAVTSATALAAALRQTGDTGAARAVVDAAIDACPSPRDPGFPPRLGSAYERLVQERARLASDPPTG